MATDPPMAPQVAGVTVVLVVVHEMTASDAVEILDVLAQHDVDVRVGGGWAVDTLVGRQTRLHSDLDLWVPAARFDRAIPAFVLVEIDRLYPWGDDRPWNFVLHDGDARRLDLHLFEEAAEGWMHYGGLRGERFPADSIAGAGVIDGRPVRCEAPEWSLRWHRGYPPRNEDRHDVQLLCATFGFELPAEFA
jgi:lincosamide nucleotidyltransferase A/C/D/E